MTDHEDHYLIPEHPGEVNRLDLQHYALREGIGTNHLAALDRPASVLDAGTGTGQWAFELGAEYPEARVVGLDRAASIKATGAPANFSFVRADLLQPLPFATGSFSYVHQRFLRAAIPAADWPADVAELARVTAPGGWVELVEHGNDLEPAGPSTRRFISLIYQMFERVGLDPVGPPTFSLARFAEQAGLTDIDVRTLTLPVGAWGGRPGSFLASDLRTAVGPGIPRMQAMLGVPADELLELARRMVTEFEEHHSLLHLEVTLGRKPAS